VIAFLSRPDAYPGLAAQSVERHETHGALVFLAGDRAFKMKRAVCFPYMDLSTLDRRQRMIEREAAINRVHAPDLYLGVRSVLRDASGALMLGDGRGDGRPVEALLEMRRFPQDCLLSAMVTRGVMTSDIAAELAAIVFDGHQRLPRHVVVDADRRMARIVDGIVSGLSQVAGILGLSNVVELGTRARCQLARSASCLVERGMSGFVRRCHGDLHLNNIVMLDGRPTLFDALEFDENLATIDTLYDLAFLIMDLDHREARPLASVVLNRYLARSRSRLDVEGLFALPLFLGVRSAIRAMTSAQRAALDGRSGDDRPVAEARSYLGHALRYLAPRPPRVVAVGGRSGTGKSTLAAALAPFLEPAPGALHVRTDVERKKLFGAAETERLPAATYTVEWSRRVYRSAFGTAEAALEAGHSVVIDAVFLAPEERIEVEALAARHEAPFTGFWLSAPRDVLIERVATRSGDASDATPEVVEAQLARPVEAVGWIQIDAGGDRDATLRQAVDRLGLAEPKPGLAASSVRDRRR
jgi:hypothetical protein